MVSTNVFPRRRRTTAPHAMPATNTTSASPARILWMLGAGQLVLWCGVAVLSLRFEAGSDFWQRPLLPVVGLFALAFVLYLASVHVVWCLPEGTGEKRQMRRTMWLFAVLMRAVMWLALPIQEVDYFRYLWDGRVLVEGVSPYAFSPAQVDAARELSANERPGELGRLVALLERAPATDEIFRHIDHRGVPTIYPPAAQAVFGVVALVTPEQAPMRTHVLVLKAVLILFDLLVTGLLVGILRSLRKAPSLALVYAWCPLTLKEFANSAHMDVIAMVLLMAAVRLALLQRAFPASRRMHRPDLEGGMAAAFWGASILAKFYPLVLAPLWWAWWRRSLNASGQLRQFGIAGLVVLMGYAAMLPLNADRDAAAAHDTLSGAGEFVRRWEMNDLLFSVVHENLRPSRLEGHAERPSPWYALMPETLQRLVVVVGDASGAAVGLGRHAERVPFLVAQVVMGGLMAGIAIVVARRPWPALNASESLLRRTFVTLAALWYLSAVQNPWYWAWALPFVVFVPRVWLAPGGLALLYYLRFWFGLAYPDATLPGGLTGMRFFDEVVVWFEHLPVLLTAAWMLWSIRRRKLSPHSRSSTERQANPLSAPVPAEYPV